MTLVPTTYRDLSREFDHPRYRQPYDYQLYPYLWDDSRSWWPSITGPRTSDWLRPLDELVTRRVRNQLIQSTTPQDWAYPMRWDNYYSGERVHVDEKGFRIDIDVHPFRPEEIVVKTNDDHIIVQGNHNKRNEGPNGMVERHFVRKYLLPRGYNANEVISDLSSDGILTIKAPPPPPAKYYTPSERLVRVHETGKLALPWK
ncbi:heat shock protein 27 [Scaptodrosophila lebanonensis]|uniref:Heat shock protein 27 n=1 Tax=Drosophila lebanonensis TaxID=7225 RepID=A0A6J2TC15_DROLE|nr:heat shock protein 27 [Scaptodrosophila lebanonensis]